MKSLQGKLLKLRLMPGAIALVIGMTLLSGCVSYQRAGISAPDYDADFLNCVADSVEEKVYSECLESALMDWLVWIEA